MGEKQQTYLVAAMVFVFAITIGGAYWYGKLDHSASASSAPVKKFRAKPGTERENARALLSSAPSAPEETTSKPIKIWGSLERDEPLRKKEREAVKILIDFDDPEAAVAQILARLENPEEDASPSSMAYLYAALAAQYLQLEPLDAAHAEEVYEQALALVGDSGAHIYVVHLYADALLQAEEFERLSEVTALDGYAFYPPSASLLELGVFRGVALEHLGRSDEALIVYLQVVDVAIVSDGDLSEEASNIFRQASLRLARIYRAQGRTGEAKAVARRVQALLRS